MSSQQWDDTARVFTAWDDAGVQTASRPYAADENAAADARALAVTRAGNLSQLFTQAKAAIGTNQTFLGLSAPTNAQTVAEVQALARQNDRIIRVLLSLLNGDPTALDSTT